MHSCKESSPNHAVSSFFEAGVAFRRRCSLNSTGSETAMSVESPPQSPEISSLSSLYSKTSANFIVSNLNEGADTFAKPRLRKFAHGKVVESVCFSPDGSKLATGSKDKFARIFEVATGKEIFKTSQIGSFLSGVNSVCFSPDGQKIAVASGDGFARIFDVSTGSEIMKTIKHGNSLSVVNSVCFSPDGRSIVTGSHDKFVRVFLVQNGREVLKSREHGGYVMSVCFSPNGKSIATGGYDHFLRIIDSRTGKDVTEPIKHGGVIYSICFSPDGTSIATGSSDNFARIFHVDTGIEIFKSGCIDGEVLSLCFSPDGMSIAVASSNHNVRVFDTGTGKEIIHKIEHGGYVTSVCFSPDGRSIATGCKDNFARILELDCSDNHLNIFQPSGNISCICLSPDGSRIAVGTSDYMVRVFDSYSGVEVLQTIVHGHIIVSICFSPDGQSIVTGSHDNFARVFDVSSGTEALKLINVSAVNPEKSSNILPRVNYFWTSNTELEIPQLVFHNRNQLSPIKPSHHLHVDENVACEVQPVIESHFNKIRMSFDHKERVTFVCFSNDGKSIATGCVDKFVRIINVAANKEVYKTCAHEGEISSICFSPNGKSIVTSSLEKVARIFHIDSGFGKPTSIAHENVVTCACFLPDGKSILTGSIDSIARIFDLNTGQEAFNTIEHGGQITHVYCSLDSSCFVTFASDKFVRFFRCDQSLHDKRNQAVRPYSIFPANMVSCSLYGTFFRTAFVLNGKVHVLLRPHTIGTDEHLPVSPDLVLLWSGLNRDLQKQWFFSDSDVTLSEFSSRNGGALVALASKCRDINYPLASSTLKRLCDGNDPVVNAGLILRELLVVQPDQKESIPIFTIQSLLRNVCRHMKYTIHDQIFIEQLIRASRISSIQHILHEFWTDLAVPVPSHPITVRDVNQVSFSRSTRLYVAGSDFIYDTVFAKHFEKYPQVKGISLEFEHWLVPFPYPSDVQTRKTQDNDCCSSQHVSDVRRKSLMQQLIETNKIDASACFLIVRAIVQFKWQMYGLSHWMKELYAYLINLFFLVTVSILMWREPRYHDDAGTVACKLISLLVAAIDSRSAYREAKQYLNGIPVADGKTSFIKRALSSSHYYHGREFWNWIKILHLILGFSVVVLVWLQSSYAMPVLSVTCFLRWWGLLFFIQAFDKTGVYVSMIVEIVKAIRWFLFIMLLSGLAHWNSFILLIKRRCESSDDPIIQCKLSDDVFSLFRTMFDTVMWLLFMTGDVLALENTDHFGLLVAVFFVSMIAVPLVLINMLIAIMGDCYTHMRSRSMVEATLLKASIILTCHTFVQEIELFMTNAEKANPDYSPRFLHVLVPVGESRLVENEMQLMRQEVSKLRQHFVELGKEDTLATEEKVKAIVEDSRVQFKNMIKDESKSFKEDIATLTSETRALQGQVAEIMQFLRASSLKQDP